MLTASVLWGIVLATDLFPRWRRVPWLLDLHRWLGGLTLFFLAGHLGALLADRHAHFRVVDVVVPFASTWRPTAVALGIAAAWLLIAVEGTALAMKRLSKRFWRDVHIASYWVFWAACIHAALSGTDTSKTLYTVTSLVAVALVVFAVSYRVLSRDLPKRVRKREDRRAAGPSTAGDGV
jgi:DMSO/TMAO reductase YedYZ heme-binding membrane subunit